MTTTIHHRGIVEELDFARYNIREACRVTSPRVKEKLDWATRWLDEGQGAYLRGHSHRGDLLLVRRQLIEAMTLSRSDVCVEFAATAYACIGSAIKLSREQDGVK